MSRHLSRLLFTLLLNSAVLLALAKITSTADITGDGVSHQLATSGTALWIQFVAPATNTGTVRIGDSGVSTTEGVPIAPGGGFMMPTVSREPPQNDFLYDLSTIYYLIPSGDKLSVTWAKQ